MKAGIDYTESVYVGYMDADLQTTPEDFNLLLKDIADYQLVMGIAPIVKILFQESAIEDCQWFQKNDDQ